MDIFECIETRRSVRTYEDRPVSEEDMDRLLALGVKAATGSALEPWGFVIINDKEEIESWSDKIKADLLARLESLPHMRRYENGLKNPKFNVFNGASTVVVIYGHATSHWKTYDCSMVACNMMLAGNAMGIGTCWIGFAHQLCAAEAFKQHYSVPKEYELMCVMSLGYMTERPGPSKRKAPLVFYRQGTE